MKTSRTIFFPFILLASFIPLLTGCYTQLAASRDGDDRPYGRSSRPNDYRYDDRTLSNDDSTQGNVENRDSDDEWIRTHERVGFRFYYPQYASIYYSNAYDPMYDPWYYNYSDCYYDPWICGTPYYGFGRPYWYNRYWTGVHGGFYGQYGNYGYPYNGGGYVVSNGTGRTRDSGARRSGGSTRNRNNNGGYSIGTSGGGSYTPPAGRSAVRNQSSGSSRGNSGVRSQTTSTQSRGTSRGSYSPPARSGGSPSGSSTGGRSSGGSTRSSGSSRSRVEMLPGGGYTPPSVPAPTRSYSPPPQSAPAPSSGAGESSRSSGATRSR